MGFRVHHVGARQRLGDELGELFEQEDVVVAESVGLAADDLEDALGPVSVDQGGHDDHGPGVHPAAGLEIDAGGIGLGVGGDEDLAGPDAFARHAARHGQSQTFGPGKGAGGSGVDHFTELGELDHRAWRAGRFAGLFRDNLHHRIRGITGVVDGLLDFDDRLQSRHGQVAPPRAEY